MSTSNGTYLSNRNMFTNYHTLCFDLVISRVEINFSIFLFPTVASFSCYVTVLTIISLNGYKIL